MALVVVFGVFVAWIMNQPTDFDTFLEGQKTFVDDLYSGWLRRLLSSIQTFNNTLTYRKFVD